LPKFDIKVRVDYQYEVEAENEAEAEELGWHYEDHAYSGEVYSIKVDEQEEDEDVELDEEVI
jgi:hypothetical protein